MRDVDARDGACDVLDAGEEQSGGGSGTAVFRKAGIAAAASLAVAACGGGDDGSGPPTDGGGGGVPPVSVRKPQSDAEAARFLLQTSVAASEAEISAVKSDGYDKWLTRQMAVKGQSGVDWLAARGYATVDTNNWFDRYEPGDYMIWQQLMNGDGEVRIRAALALSEFFVVGYNGIDLNWRAQCIARYWDILAENAFGDFRKLLEDITLNPAMGVWLNTRGNRKASGTRVPDENYAREVMQLFSIGLYQLNPDGTLKAGANGQPIETYTNDDVSGLARVFTGYDFDFTGNVQTPHATDANRKINGIAYTQLPMTADPAKWQYPRARTEHAGEEKTFLGTTIPAGTGAAESLKIALDALFNHPNVGPFLGRQMIQRLVTSNPSPGYVQRVAARFNDNGQGKRGDLGAMFKAIWLDDEALAAANVTSTSFGKVREPMLRLAQWARTFGATSKSGSWQVRETQSNSSRLGQSPLRSPSVFNFFRPGYVPANSNTGNNRLVAPELQLVNEISVAGYANFMSRVIEGREGTTNDLEVAYTKELELAHTPDALLDRLNLLLTANQLSDASKSTIRAAISDASVTATSSQTDKLRRVYAAVMLVMAAPDYLVQK